MANDTLYNALERVGNLLRMSERQIGAEYGLQPVHLHTLHYLARCNKYSNTLVAVTEYLGMTKGTVSQTIQVLQNKGYIEKASNKKDKRQVHLSVSKKGSKLLQQEIPPAIFGNLDEEISNEKQQSIAENLLQLLTALQNSNKLSSFGVCNSCSYFLKEETSFRCGLTKEKLTKSDTLKICREHNKN